MDQKLQRIFLRRIESRRLNYESLHVLVVRALERERLQRLHVDLRQQRVVHVGYKCRLAIVKSEPPDFVWGRNGHPCKEKVFARANEIICMQREGFDSGWA